MLNRLLVFLPLSMAQDSWHEGYSSEPDSHSTSYSPSRKTESTPTRTSVPESHVEPSSDDIPLWTLAKNRTLASPLSSDDMPLCSPVTPRCGPVSRHQYQPLPSLYAAMFSSTSANGRHQRPRSSSHSIILTPNAEKKLVDQKRADRRRETLSKAYRADVKVAEMAAQAEKEEKEAIFNQALSVLKEGKCTLVELLLYVFNPTTILPTDWRWRGFFMHKAMVRQLFDIWTSGSYRRTAGRFLSGWAVEFVESIVNDEAKLIAKKGILSKTKKVIDEAFFLGYSVTSLTDKLESAAPAVFKILTAFSTTTRQKTQLTAKWLEKKRIVSS